MSWVFLSLSAALLWSAIALSNKLIMTHRVRNPFFATAVYGAGLFVLTALVAFAKGEFYLAPQAAAMAFGAGVFSGLALLLYFIALDEEEISRVMPVLSTTTIFVLLISFLALGERLSLQQYAGSLAIVAGAFLISARRTGGLLRLNRAFYLLMAAAVLDALRNVLTKTASANSISLAVFFWLAVGFGFLSAFLFVWKRGSFAQTGAAGLPPLLFVSFLYTLATFANTAAISSGSVSLASALIETASLFTFAFATALSAFKSRLLKEDLSRKVLLQKAVAVALVIAGVLLVS